MFDLGKFLEPFIEKCESSPNNYFYLKLKDKKYLSIINEFIIGSSIYEQDSIHMYDEKESVGLYMHRSRPSVLYFINQNTMHNAMRNVYEHDLNYSDNHYGIEDIFKHLDYLENKLEL